MTANKRIRWRVCRRVCIRLSLRVNDDHSGASRTAQVYPPHRELFAANWRATLPDNIDTASPDSSLTPQVRLMRVGYPRRHRQNRNLPHQLLGHRRNRQRYRCRRCCRMIIIALCCNRRSTHPAHLPAPAMSLYRHTHINSRGERQRRIAARRCSAVNTQHRQRRIKPRRQQRTTPAPTTKPKADAPAQSISFAANCRGNIIAQCQSLMCRRQCKSPTVTATK